VFTANDPIAIGLLSALYDASDKSLIALGLIIRSSTSTPRLATRL